jgi:hypothetical protein
VSKAANGRSSIHRRKNGQGWEGWVSFGEDASTGKRIRKHVRGRTKVEVSHKIKLLESDRDGGYSAASRDVTLLEWLDYWIESRRNNVRPKTIAGYKKVTAVMGVLDQSVSSAYYMLGFSLDGTERYSRSLHLGESQVVTIATAGNFRLHLDITRLSGDGGAAFGNAALYCTW